MTSRRTLVVAGVVLVTLVGGCSAVSRLKALQPPPLVSGTALRVPTPPPALQLGVDIAADMTPGVNVAAAAQADVAYLHRLHANAVSLTIPLFMHGPAADTVHSSRSTPTPAQVDVLAVAALRAPPLRIATAITRGAGAG